MDTRAADPAPLPGEAAARAAVLRSRAAATGLDIPVDGASMGSAIPAGSRVTVGAGSVPRPGEIWAAVDPDGRLLVHRVRRVQGSRVVLRGDANRADDPALDRDLLVGRVTAVRTGDRVRRVGRLDRWWGATVLGARGLARRLVGRRPGRRHPR